MILEYLRFAVEFAFVVYLVVLQISNKKERLALLNWHKTREKDWINERNQLNLTLIATSQSDKDKIFELEKMRLENNGKELEGRWGFLNDPIKEAKKLNQQIEIEKQKLIAMYPREKAEEEKVEFAD